MQQFHKGKIRHHAGLNTGAILSGAGGVQRELRHINENGYIQFCNLVMAVIIWRCQ